MVEKVKIRIIDVTPTWLSILPILIASITDGNSEARKLAMGELERMAKLADEYVKENKK